MRRAYIELHIAVLLFGFTAILGKLITIPATSLVWWRVCIASMSMLLLVRLGRTLRTLPRKRVWQFLGIGTIVALHWITFFGSIKAANASVALVMMATASFFTSLIEPVVMKQRTMGRDVLLGLLIIPAMVLIVRGIDPGMHLGIWLGLISAILVSLFASLNKLLIGEATPMQISFFELTGAWVFISLCLLIISFMPDTSFITDHLPSMEISLQWPVGMDWFYLLVLAIVCTTLAYVLAVRALHYLSAFASGLVINLEPVYGIVLAWLLLKENRELTPGFYIGVSIILIVVFAYPFITKRQPAPDEDHGSNQDPLSHRQ